MVSLTKAANFATKGITVESYYAQKSKVISEIADKFERSIKAEKNHNGFISKQVCKIIKTDEKSAKTVEQYKDGTLTYKKALNRLKIYTKSPQKILDTAMNIAAYNLAGKTTTALAASAAAGGEVLSGAGVCAIGAITGMIVKTGIKMADRATNKIKGDAINPKKIKKDGISGCISGALAQISADTASIFRALFGL